LTDYRGLLAALSANSVDFVLVGGMAAAVHGSIRATRDVDIVYSRKPKNLARIVAALGPLHPRLRGAPEGLPFQFDAPTVAGGLNFTLSTDLGAIDALGEITGGGTFEALLPTTESVDVLGVPCRVVTLEKLIQLKRAAGRPRDLDAIAELEALREERRRG
jgi:predicted nucleotidyltransferase